MLFPITNDYDAALLFFDDGEFRLADEWEPISAWAELYWCLFGQTNVVEMEKPGVYWNLVLLFVYEEAMNSGWAAYTRCSLSEQWTFLSSRLPCLSQSWVDRSRQIISRLLRAGLTERDSDVAESSSRVVQT